MAKAIKANFKKASKCLWNCVSHVKVLESEYYLPGQALNLSIRPSQRIVQVTEFLSNNSLYSLGQRGAVKGILPEAVRRDLEGSTVHNFPTKGEDLHIIQWKFLPGNNVMRNTCYGKDECNGILSTGGLTNCVGIVSPPGTMNCMHPEDCFLCSINVNVYGGIKIWIVIDSDPANYDRLPWLLNNGIRFGIIYQAPGEMIISNPRGEHQILNPQQNITYSRNLGLMQNIEVFIPDGELYKCDCKTPHVPESTDPLRGIINQLFISNWWSDVENERLMSENQIEEANELMKRNTYSPRTTTTRDSKCSVRSGEKPLRRYRCRDCNATFARLQYLKEHVNLKHLHEIGNFFCDECGKVFDRRRGLTQHKHSHMKRLNLPCACHICGKKYKNVQSRRVHMNKAHKCTKQGV